MIKYPEIYDDAIVLPGGTPIEQPLPEWVDKKTAVNAANLNKFRDAILRIEKTLGIVPQGVYGTVRERLDAMMAEGNVTVTELEIPFYWADDNTPTEGLLVYPIEENDVPKVATAIARDGYCEVIGIASDTEHYIKIAGELTVKCYGDIKIDDRLFLSGDPAYRGYATNIPPFEDGYAVVYVGQASSERDEVSSTCKIWFSPAQPVIITSGTINEEQNEETPATEYWFETQTALYTRIGTAVGESYFVSGRDEAGLGGGTWYWSDDTTTAGNNGTVIVPTFVGTRSGCWKRQIEDHINVLWFGAKGDGETDDTGAIRLAIASISQEYSEHHPFKLFFPARPLGYVVTDTLVFNDVMNLAIEFEAPTLFDRTEPFSRYQIKWFGNSLTKAVIEFTGACLGISIDNLSIDGYADPTNRDGRALVGIAFGEFDGPPSNLKKYIHTKQINIVNCRFGAWFGNDSGVSSDVAHHIHSNWCVGYCQDTGVLIASGNAAGICFLSSLFMLNGAHPTTDGYNPSGYGSNAYLIAGHMHLISCCTNGGTPGTEAPVTADILATAGGLHINNLWSDTHGICVKQFGPSEGLELKGIRHYEGWMTDVNTPTSIETTRKTLIDGCYLFGDVVCNSGGAGSVTAIATEFFSLDLSRRPTLGIGTFKGDIVTTYKGLISINGRGNNAQILIGGGTRNLQVTPEVGANPPQILSVGSGSGLYYPDVLQALWEEDGYAGYQLTGPNKNSGAPVLEINCYKDVYAQYKAHMPGMAWLFMPGGGSENHTGGLCLRGYYFTDTETSIPITSFAECFTLINGGTAGSATEFAHAFPNRSTDPTFSSGNWWRGGVYFNTADNGGTGGYRVNVGGGTWKRIPLDPSWVDVTWFGAVGDGTTDDLTAIQAAIDYAAGLSGEKIVVFPRGKTYAVSSTITIKSGVTLDGQGSTIKRIGLSRYPLIQNYNYGGTGGDGLDILDTNFAIKRFTLIGTGDSVGIDEQGHGIDLWCASDVVIEEINTQNTNGDGVAFRNVDRTTVRKINIGDFGRNGFSPCSGLNNHFEQIVVTGEALPGADPGADFNVEPSTILERSSATWLNCSGRNIIFVDLFSHITNPALVDGDMELANTTSWLAYHCSLSKETTDPYDGYRCLRVTSDGNLSNLAYQAIFVVGRTYRVRGWARSDGTQLPKVARYSEFVWTGTNSTSWQDVDVTYVADDDKFYIGMNSTTGYVEWDGVYIEDVTPGAIAEFAHEAIITGCKFEGYSPIHVSSTNLTEARSFVIGDGNVLSTVDGYCITIENINNIQVGKTKLEYNSASTGDAYGISIEGTVSGFKLDGANIGAGLTYDLLCYDGYLNNSNLVNTGLHDVYLAGVDNNFVSCPISTLIINGSATIDNNFDPRSDITTISTVNGGQADLQNFYRYPSSMVSTWHPNDGYEISDGYSVTTDVAFTASIEGYPVVVGLTGCTAGVVVTGQITADGTCSITLVNHSGTGVTFAEAETLRIMSIIPPR